MQMSIRIPSVLALICLCGSASAQSWGGGMGAIPYFDPSPGWTQQWAYEGAACASDIDGSGGVDVGDLLAVIAGWGGAEPDLDGDGSVNVSDLLQVIQEWGSCEGGWQQYDGWDPNLIDAYSGVIRVTIPLERIGVDAGDTILFDVASTGPGDGDPGVDHLSNPEQATPWWYVQSVAGPFLSYTITTEGGSGLAYDDTVGDVFADGCLDIVRVEVSNDASNLYVMIEADGDLSVEDWSQFMVLIDSRDGGTGDNPWGRNMDLGGAMVDAFLGAGCVRDDGTQFRVWAPNANEVTVAGNFNGWDFLAHQLWSEGNGFWSSDVTGAMPGDQYKFVIRNGDNWFWRNDPYARRVTNSTGNSIIYDSGTYSWSGDTFYMPSFNDLVIYELHIGSFGSYAPGNIQEVTSRLDYLADLGINAIELMPFVEFPGDVSWGYNPSYPFAVESHYGTPGDFKWFVEQAHARGIAVLADVVYNHLGPSDLDLWQFDGWNTDGNGGIYFYQDSRAETPWGPRPDYGRGEVRQYIRDNVLYWLQEYQMDGIRVDATKWIHRTDGGESIPEGWGLLQWINNEIDASQPWKFSTSEDMDLNQEITNGTGSGGAGFDAQWDAAFVHPLRGVLTAGSDAERDMDTVRSCVTYQYSGDAFKRIIFTESHDEVAAGNGKQRLVEAICPGCADSWYAKKRSTLGAAVMFTSPGVPMLFMGQEFLEDGSWDDWISLDWSRAGTYSGILQMYKDLISLRRNFWGNTEGLRGGGTNFFHQNNSDKIVAWHRFANGGAGDDVVVAANFSVSGRTGYRIGLPQGGTWYVRFNSDASSYDGSFSNWGTVDLNAEAVPWDGMGYSAEINIGPYSTVIFSQ